MADFDWDKPTTQTQVPDWDKPTPKKVEPTVGQELKAGGKSALESTPGAAGGFAGAEMGAKLGSRFGLPGAVIGGFGGGLAGYLGGEYLGKKAGQAIPSEVKEKTGFTPEQRKEERRTMPVASTVGGLIPDVAAVAPGAIALTKGAIGKTGELVQSFKSPQPIADVKGLEEVGEKGFDLIKRRAESLFKSRTAEADTKYKDAFNAARIAQAKGEPFATSAPGQKLLADLEAEKNIIAGGQQFEKGSEKVAGINRLIESIKGTTTGGGTVPIGKGLVSSKLSRKLPTQTKEKDIEAIVEELRFLRDVDAKGKTYEAYAQLDAKYKRDLISKLENSLYEWNQEYKAADEAYKAASRKLDPFRTSLMQNAMKGEKFDPKSLVASPEDFGPKFFSDVNSVRQLKEVTQDPTAVTKLGKEYVASLFAEKSPSAVKTFVSDAKNAPWLKEAGIYDDVVNYANQTVKAESRQKILSKLGYAAAGGTLGAALGAPLYYGIRRSFGL